jgi:hypothetical protein
MSSLTISTTVEVASGRSGDCGLEDAHLGDPRLAMLQKSNSESASRLNSSGRSVARSLGERPCTVADEGPCDLAEPRLEPRARHQLELLDEVETQHFDTRDHLHSLRNWRSLRAQTVRHANTTAKSRAPG